MRYATLLIAIITLSLSNQAVAFGDEPSIPTVKATAPAEETAKEPTLLEKVAKFEKGKTTLAEVMKELGQPAKIMTMPDETKQVAYSNVAASRNAASYIPIIGAYAGKVNVKGEGANMIFDKQDILKEKSTFQY